MTVCALSLGPWRLYHRVSASLPKFKKCMGDSNGSEDRDTELAMSFWRSSVASVDFSRIDSPLFRDL